MKVRVHSRTSTEELNVKEIEGKEGTLELNSIGCTLELAIIYVKTIDLEA